jgi:TonB family protein
MDRLQKKCFVGSVTGHVALIVIVLSSAAFVSSEKKANPDSMKDLQIIEFVPLVTTDALVAPGGGNPNAAKPPEVMTAPPAVAPTPAAQATPEPEPEPPPQTREPEQKAAPEPEPEPVAPAPKPAIREPAPKPAPKTPKAPKDDSSLVPGAKKQPRKFEFKSVVRGADSKTDSKAEAKKQAAAAAAERAAERRERELRRRLAAGIASAVSAVGQSSSRGVAIELYGPGGGGVPYANFFQAVMGAYNRAWHLPDSVTDEAATAEATVVIARDGTVISARISKPSGNSGLDRSVRSTLDRVKWAAPLPESEKENQRTVTINFNVGAKRGLG